MRVGLYTDYPYRRSREGLSADRSFAEFVNRVGENLGGLTLFGRLEPTGARYRHPVRGTFDFIALPHYESLAHPWEVMRTSGATIRRFWRELGRLDCVWLLGPHPFAIAFALLALLRGRRVVLGVRQDWIAYVRHRHPGARHLWAAALVMEALFRLIGHVADVIAVGPDLAHRYRKSRSLTEIAVSLVDDEDLTPTSEALARSYEGELVLLSVGRLESEKNPLLLPEILAALRKDDPRWKMVICGEGPLQSRLDDRLTELGLSESAEIRGYVPFGPALMEQYRAAHVFLHVSWTEGFPQVLLEAFAAGLPVVATDVGGISAAVGDAVRLIPPGDAGSAAAAVQRIRSDPSLRASIISAGCDFVRGRTLSAEAARVTNVLSEGLRAGQTQA